MEDSLKLEEALLSMDRAEVGTILEGAVARGELDVAITGALESIGQRWDAGEVALSQVYMAGRLCEQAVTQFEPTPPTEGVAPRVGIAVLEDYHMLGKRIVLSVLRAAGRPVLDLGRLTVDELIDRVCAEQLEVVLVSVLMFPSALRVREVVDGLALRGSNAKVVVGGAPFRLDAELAGRVGAHHVGRTASDALRILAELEAR